MKFHFQVKLSYLSLQAVQINIPSVHHMTELGPLGQAMFSLMRKDVGASCLMGITQKTCRIKSHLS